MAMIKRFLAAAAAAAALSVSAAGQVRTGDEGQLSASFETNTIYYVDDKGLAGSTPDDRFGSNNYLKIDYNYKKLSAGIQLEGYFPALYGYELGQQADPKKFFLGSKYISWDDENFSVLVGNVYEQFGNGLIFRSYEDRQLGLNNSLEGVRASYSFSRFVAVKGMYGRPRLYTDYAGSWVRGLDLSVSVADIFNWDNILLSVEGSYVNRYEALDKDVTMDFYSLGLDTPQLNMYSGRVNFGWKGLSVKGEYAAKSKDLPMPGSSRAVRGAAIFGEAIYSWKSFSVSGTFRMIENMGTMLTLYGAGTGNSLNYLPSLTRQYTYMLANLNPYQVNVAGETAGQVDVYYSLRNRNDRHRYWNFHANYSTAYTLNGSQSATGKVQLMWSDANVDIERQWNRKLKTILLYSRQQWSPSHGAQAETYVSNIFVGDVTYKFDRKKSLRAEVQYLLSSDYEGDWVAGLVEFSFAPMWSVFASDMYNLEGTRKNYYNAGFSFTKGRTRIQLSYGRNRAGYICSGGVCRYSPAYTGLNLAMTTSF